MLVDCACIHTVCTTVHKAGYELPGDSKRSLSVAYKLYLLLLYRDSQQEDAIYVGLVHYCYNRLISVSKYDFHGI